MVKRAFALAAAGFVLPAWPAQHLLLEAQLEPAQVYVQAQAVYRLRLYRAVDVQDLQLTVPAPRLADLRQIGAERVYEALRDGRRYRVHERNYAVFPFASGTLELAGAHATGRLPVAGARSADGRQTVRIDALPQALTVLPAPAGMQAWLPAQALALAETWAEAPAGAWRRTIRIEATGIEAAQLPELPMAAAGITVRAEPARLENRFAGERHIGVREQAFIVTRSGAGPAVAPAVQLQWWHTGKNMLMTAALPARVLAAPAAGAPRRTTLPAWLPAGGLLLISAAAWLFHRRGMARTLRAACRRGDARAVRDGLLAWAATVWPDAPPRTLATLAARLPDPAARRAVAGLERALYGPHDRAPDAAALRAIVRQATRSARRTAGIMRCAVRKNTNPATKQVQRKRNRP